jgi:hypothetical protein
MATFQAVVQLHGKTATGIAVPEEVVTALGAGKRPAVRVTLRDHTYRTTVAPMGGEYLVPVSADIRKAAGVAAGDELMVGIEIDDQPREVAVPADVDAALDTSPAARQAFDRLAYSHKLRYVLSVEGAKTPETRNKRIAKMLVDLGGG